MDDFTRQHLAAWGAAVLHDDERDLVLGRIVRFVAEYPDVLADRSWPEIRKLADRKAERDAESRVDVWKV